MRPMPVDPRDQEKLHTPQEDRRPATPGQTSMRRRTRDLGRAVLAAVFLLAIALVLIALL
jgi:hypothetical protein